MTFDTLASMRRLEAAGIEPKQAEAHAEAVRDAVTESAATKADLKAATAELKAELTWRMVLLGGAVVAAVKLIA